MRPIMFKNSYERHLIFTKSVQSVKTNHVIFKETCTYVASKISYEKKIITLSINDAIILCNLC